MNIVYCLTRNLYPHIKSNINILLNTNKKNINKIYLIIEDDFIEGIDYEQVEFINVNKIAHGFDTNGVNWDNGWTYMTLIRCALPDIFKDLDRILYLDVDTIIFKDLSDLYNIDFEDNYMAGVYEPKRRWHAPNYVNAGVLMMNLKKMREDNISTQLIDLINTKKLCAPDNDAINIICENKILLIDPKFNSYKRTNMVKDPVIVHCTLIHQWHPFSGRYNKIYQRGLK